MLYHAYELNHAALAPWRELAGFQKRLFQSSYNPLSETLYGRNMIASCELFESLTRRYGKPEWGIEETMVNGAPVSVSESVVWKKPFCKLVHFKRDASDLKKARSETRVDPRVLLVAPLSGHYATLLRSTVEAFLPDHEVYVTDWVDARNVPISRGEFNLHTYIDYVAEILEQIGEGIHVVAICQPGPPVLAAISMMAKAKSKKLPASMTYMGSPIDPRESPTLPNNLALERPFEWFRDNMIYTVPWPHKGVMRKVYPGFLQLSGFISMNQDKHMSAHKEYFDHLVEGDCDSAQKHREFYDEYLSVLDLPAEFYLDTIREIFQQHTLPKGEFLHNGELIDPGCITGVALMTVEGERDDISGIGQTQAAHTLCKNIPEAMRIDYIQPGVGHYGVFSGRRFRTEIQPRIREFMRSYFDVKKEKQWQKAHPDWV